ncbi:MAG: hypothetical protein ABSE73_12205 [Planctomycetota bacterium]
MLLAVCAAAEEGAEIVYKNDLEKEEVGKEAADIGMVMVGEGDLRVKLDGQNKVLELAPYPLDTCGFLFGPAGTEDMCVRIRISAASAGRRFPVFAVGLGGVGGYMLRLTPIRKALELLKSDEVKESATYTWTSGAWTMLALSVRKLKDGAWSIRGKAWEYGKEEPKEWLVACEDTEKPPAGRAGAWGTAYSGEPVRFAGLVVQKEPAASAPAGGQAK